MCARISLLVLRALLHFIAFLMLWTPFPKGGPIGTIAQFQSLSVGVRPLLPCPFAVPPQSSLGSPPSTELTFCLGVPKVSSPRAGCVRNGHRAPFLWKQTQRFLGTAAENIDGFDDALAVRCCTRHPSDNTWLDHSLMLSEITRVDSIITCELFFKETSHLTRLLRNSHLFFFKVFSSFSTWGWVNCVLSLRRALEIQF